jgi:type I restriction enzyme S subunit
MGELWLRRRAKDFAARSKVINAAGELLPPLSITKSRGVILQSDKYKKQIATDLRKYVVTRRDQFAFDPMSLYYGAIGQVTFPEVGLVSPDYVVFDVDSSVHKPFMNFLLRFPAQVARYETVAETGNQFGKRRRVYWSVFEELEFQLPPLGEQRKIASILSSVDNAIEATQAVIDQLQVVKSAMMVELLARGLPGLHTRFKHTEIGDVPEGWSVSRLGDSIREPIRNGYSPTCPTSPTGKWILHLGAVTFDGFNPFAIKPAPIDDLAVDAALLRDGDLVISRSNTRNRVGLAGVYVGSPSPCAYPDLLMRVRTKIDLLPEFLEAVLLSPRGRAYFSSRARGTSESMVKVNREIVEGFLVLCPPLDEQKKIVSHLQVIDKRRWLEGEYLQALQMLKSALMSALLTGDLRVTPDPEPA